MAKSAVDFVRELTARLDGEVDATPGARAMYGTDASNYRRVPRAVVFPMCVEDILATVQFCADAGVGITMRGGGTSVAGNAIGSGIVIDTSRHLDRILTIDPERRIARVEPGVVLASLQHAAQPYGLRFGPDPSTIGRCTLGGMIGNNACGNHSVAWGTTADNVHELTILTPEGTLLRVGDYSREQWARRQERDGAEGRIFRDLDLLEAGSRQVWRQELSAFSRRVSGYGVDHLLPERGRSLAKALVGTEGTCVIVLDATVRLVQPPPVQILTVLGFADDVAAADAVPSILEHRPLTVEGVDADLLALVNTSVKSALPDGRAWLFIELGGATADEARTRVDAMLSDIGANSAFGPSSLIIVDERQRAALWRLRKDSAGLATRDAAGNEAWPGWEDAAVPPDRLGSYLREFRALLHRHGLRGLTYGHFGEGCIHVRIDFDLLTAAGVAQFGSFIDEAADTVVAHGGSLSGEHGDGLSRSALLGKMYSAEVIRSFTKFSRIFDPADILNPGIINDPPPFDDNLRYRSATLTDLPPPRLRYPEDDGSLIRAVRRCVGVGKCRSDEGAVMCPSWLATGEEKHSTRGRARLLQEILAGDAVPKGWRSKDAREALDLCLACKGCSSDCPVEVDMATYKAEFLYQHYRRRRRPLAHYSMGWLPLVARLATRIPRTVNAVTGSGLQSLLKRASGIDQRRAIPQFARQSFLQRQRPRDRRTAEALRRPGAQEVLLWPDTFNNYLTPDVLDAGLSVLEAAGVKVRTPDSGVCCGLTWFSTGQLGIAERVLRRTAKALSAAQYSELPVVVLEPSCATMLRSEARAVLGDTEATRYLGRNVYTLAEALERFAPSWEPPKIDAPAVGQVHCHQTSVLGFEPDERLMSRAGVDASGMQRGCCGLAGNFGFENGHAEISSAIAEHHLLPALRSASSSTIPIADGFSCRIQMSQLGGVRARHLAEMLAEGLPEE